MSISCSVLFIRRFSAVLLAAGALFQAALVWTALCGVSTPAIAVMLAAFTAATLLSTPVSQWIAGKNRQPEVIGYTLYICSAVALAAACLLPLALDSLLGMATNLLPVRSPATSFLAYAVPGILLTTVPALLWSVSRVLHEPHGVSDRCFVLQVLLSLPIVALPQLAGVSPLMLMALAAATAVVAQSLFPMSAAPAPKALKSAAPAERRTAAVGTFLAGMLTAALACFWSRLMPLQLPQLTLLLSLTAGLLLSLRPWLAKPRAERAAAFASLLGLALFAPATSAFPMLFLGISESIQTEVLRWPVQALTAAIPSALLLCAPLCASGLFSATHRSRSFVSGFAPGVLLSIVAGSFLPLTQLLPLWLACTGAGTFLLLTNTAVMASRPSLRLQLAALAMLLAIPLAAPQFDGHTASRLLFSARTGEARSRGLDADLIPHTEPARLASVETGAAGEVAVWRNSAAGIELLRSGILTARASSDTRISPQSPEEVLPAILGLCNHSRPGRVLVLGDDSGVLLRSCTHFPVQQILAVRTDSAATAAATKYVWEKSPDRPHLDDRVHFLHADLALAARSHAIGQFDVVLLSHGPGTALRHAPLLTQEFLSAIRARLEPGGVFCQRLSLENPGPEVLRQVLATLASVFRHAGAIQAVPGEFLLLASDHDAGLIHPQLLDHLQRTHVQQEAASCGWDWAQIAVLPLATADGESGLFAKTPAPSPLAISGGSALLTLPFQTRTAAEQSTRLREAFAPFQQQVASAVPPGEAHEEAKRRLASLQQQVEILAGMPDQPWTYRKSLRMEMQRSPRPPLEHVANGKIIRSTHPLDKLRQDYFLTLGRALQTAQSQPASALDAVQQLSRMADGGEPLLGWFAHYEIVRLYELLQHPDPAAELRHRLHLVFFAAPSDASVRPAISALQMLVDQPQLITDSAARYDQLNAVLQKLIERWEARTAWEPRSAARVQQDVDLSVQAGRQALEQMQLLAAEAGIPDSEFRQRRQFVHEALISPLRAYCEQVLAHRMKTETPAAASGTEDPDDLPLLAPSLSTN